MNAPRIFITSAGIISPFGKGKDAILPFLQKNVPALRPLSLFPTPSSPLPVGEVSSPLPAEDMPRTHLLAMAAAEEAMKTITVPPDAIIVGTTTGGMARTEELLKKEETNAAAYQYHSAGSVAEVMARRFGCQGTVLAVSTACSSGLAALKLGMDLIRTGKAACVLAGGADSLCRLTYYGFHSLQLTDPTGARPFDRNRHGMSVGEGAAMFVLTAGEEPPPNAIAELLGAGLTCDAHHAATPHPHGEGTRQAMEQALAEAGLSPQDVNYINLHGTGTPENDLAEGKAIFSLFQGEEIPALSSLKGAWGHSLAASGAMGAVVAAMAIQNGFIPPNTGLKTTDPDIMLTPETTFIRKNISCAMVNALGFGGNNAVMVMGKPERQGRPSPLRREQPFFVHGRSMLTGWGNTAETFARLDAEAAIRGTVPKEAMHANLPAKTVRRLKRLSRLALSLSISAAAQTSDNFPEAVFFGTRWGSLSETSDFLKALFETEEQLGSPTDFIGSVHNAPAGQVAVHFQAKGPNITITGGDATFEQTLFAADRSGVNTLLLIGADEYHEHLTPLFAPGTHMTDGGGAFLLSRERKGAVASLIPIFEAFPLADEEVIDALVSHLGGPSLIQEKFDLILAGFPPDTGEQCQKQKEIFLRLTNYRHPLIDYRSILGHFGSVSAVAAVISVLSMEKGRMPRAFGGGESNPSHGKSILILNFGKHVTALEVSPCEGNRAP
ncbi:MAG: beta-ketoacyl synthase chain length factor [Syntrophobacterales bacterium]|nr:beta-ketoacyl synthase chain length factor [Syntrophobacterales bacterium]